MYLLIVADDDDVDFGPCVALPGGMEPFPDDGLLHIVNAVSAAVNRLALRTLVRKGFPAFLAGTAAGIGSAADMTYGADTPRRLLPDTVEESRNVRLLTRPPTMR